MYYFSVKLLDASMVASAAWVLTSILRASATTKYWIWVATAFNFIVPSGALIKNSPAMNRSSGVRTGKNWFQRSPNLLFRRGRGFCKQRRHRI
jgi:hypothetical protein